jgi:hypothetical protein
MCSAPDSPTLEEPDVVSRTNADDTICPMADSTEDRPPQAGQRDDLPSPPRSVGPPCMAPQRVPGNLPSGVLRTITEARAPSTRRLYAQKWKMFSDWCEARNLNPETCEVPSVLVFLQELLEAGRTPSTLKVYVAAIAASHDPVEGRTLGKNHLVVRFLRGARRINPPRPPSVPIWDLATVLDALKSAPFEPLRTVHLKQLSLKTALLLALASVKRVGDLHALSSSAACLEFGPNDSRVVLRPKHGYIPKVLSTPFRAQVISLAALSSPADESDANLLCPVRALRVYLERSALFRQTEQLFVCFGGRTKGLAVSKQRISRWIVDAIALAYEAKGLQCPLGIRAHSTRGMASSWDTHSRYLCSSRLGLAVNIYQVL